MPEPFSPDSPDAFGPREMKIIPPDPVYSPLELLAQAVLENRVQIVSAARQGTYEIRVKNPIPAADL